MAYNGLWYFFKCQFATISSISSSNRFIAPPELFADGKRNGMRAVQEGEGSTRTVSKGHARQGCEICQFNVWQSLDRRIAEIPIPTPISLHDKRLRSPCLKTIIKEPVNHAERLNKKCYRLTSSLVQKEREREGPNLIRPNVDDRRIICLSNRCARSGKTVGINYISN